MKLTTQGDSMKRDEVIKKYYDSHQSVTDTVVVKDIVGYGFDEELLTMFMESLVVQGYLIRLDEEKGA